MVRTLAVAVLAGFGAFWSPGWQPNPAGRGSLPPLHISAVAYGPDDRPLTDLRKEDIEVWIGGYRIPIETLTVVDPADMERGRLIVLLLDDTTLPHEFIPHVKDIARRFVNRMAPKDEMSVVALNGDAMESTSDRARLLRSIDAVGLLQAAGVQRFEDIGAQVFRSVAALSRQIVERPGRKAIVALGPAAAFDTPILPTSVSRSLLPEWTDAMRATASAGVQFYVVDPGGVGAQPTFNGTSGFARETGGQAFLNTNDFDGVADRILREMSSYYVITVADPPVRRTSDLRELEVKVLRRDVIVRARRAIPGRP
jgi:VWFA-related protein